MTSRIIASTIALSSLVVLAEQNERQCTIRDVACAIKTHADDPTFFKKINYSLELKANPDVNFEKWRSIVHSFVDLSLIAQFDSENNSKWLDLLGYPFKDVIGLSGDKTGIHGALNMGFTPDTVTLSGSFERTDQSSGQEWQEVVRIWSDVIDRAVQKSEKEDYEWDKGVGEMLIAALGTTRDGIRMNIQLRFEDMRGDRYEIGYTN